MAEIRTTSSTGGEKGTKPQRHSLVPREGLDTIAEVFAFGAEKYADHNWRKGYEWSKSYDALVRHLTAWWSGEDLDPESGLSHLGHAGFHIMALATWQRQGGIYEQFDDRYKPEAPGEPKTYGEALEREIAEFTKKARAGQTYDEDAWDVQIASENVQRYGADAEYPCQGLTREVWEAREAERAERSRQQARRAKLALDGLEPEEPMPPGSIVKRGDVLGEGWEDIGFTTDEAIFTAESPSLISILDDLTERMLSDRVDHTGIFAKPVTMDVELTNVPIETIKLACGIPLDSEVVVEWGEPARFTVDAVGEAADRLAPFVDVDLKPFQDAVNKTLANFADALDMPPLTRWDRG